MSIRYFCDICEEELPPVSHQRLKAVIGDLGVAIYSSRSGQPGGIAAMEAWLRQNAGATWYESPAGPGLENIIFPTEKPPALVTLDDRAITFTGTWPAIETLLDFKPWNKS